MAEEGFDLVYGARPLKRVIQREVLNPLASRILSGEIREGSHVLVDRSDGSWYSGRIRAVSAAAGNRKPDLKNRRGINASQLF